MDWIRYKGVDTKSYWRTTLSRVALAGGLLVSAFLLYLPPEVASSLAIPPDSSEYAIGLVNLLEHGRFGFTLNGCWYPSRYSPWFSLTCLTPAYLLGGGNVLCFHWAILGFAVALLGLMYKWGVRLGLGLWAVLPPVLIMTIPDFAFYSRIVMTEIPYISLFAISALLFLRLSDKRQELSMRFCFACGAVVAWGGAVRPTMIPMLLLFLIVIIYRQCNDWPRCLKLLFCVVIPTFFYMLLNLTYNYFVFSNPFRSGYHYWMPIPSDYPDLTFNLSYIWTNAKILLADPMIQFSSALIIMTIACSLMVIVSRRRRGGFREEVDLHLLLLLYFLFQGAVLMGLYLPYYWQDSRFFLVLVVCVIPLFLSSVRLVLDSTIFRFLSYGVISLFCAFSYLNTTPRYSEQPSSRQRWFVEGQISLQNLPPGSLVIQGGDDNVFEHFGFRDKKITLLPYNRAFDYARHMIAPVSIRNLGPRPSDCWQRNIPELMEKGICSTPFPDTFCENPSRVADWIHHGGRAFVSWDVVGGVGGWERFQQKLGDLGLATRLVGAWSAPEILPNPLRHCYDCVVLPECHMDKRPRFACILYEIIDNV